MKKVLIALFVSVVMIGPVSAANVAHTLVGGVIVHNVNETAKFVTAIPYNVPFPSLALCQAAIDEIEQASFSPRENVTNAWATTSSRVVTLQCVQRAAGI